MRSAKTKQSVIKRPELEQRLWLVRKLISLSFIAGILLSYKLWLSDRLLECELPLEKQKFIIFTCEELED